MLGLRQKLFFALGGTLSILTGMGILSGLLLTKYSSTLENLFSENYKSVNYSQIMKDVVDELDDRVQMSFWSDKTRGYDGNTQILINRFNENIEHEKNNITLPGEGEVVERIEKQWSRYRSSIEILVTMQANDQNRRQYYQETLLPLSRDLKELAQRVIDMNLANVVSVDGQVKASAIFARNAMIGLVAFGVLFGIIFTSLVGRSILRPLTSMTHLVREIESGNLDLAINVKSKDELGQLAEAFNSMAAKLREYRHSDRAKLFRIQRTTQLALNSFPDAVTIVGLDGKVELANEMAQNQFALAPGVDLATSKHKGLWDLFQQVFTTLHPVYPKAYKTAIQVFYHEKEHFFLPQAVPILSEDKSLMGVTIVLADVTELRRLDEMKSNLVSVVSHELKTPLTSIRMATHLLLEERVGSLTEKQTELLLTARDDAERLNEIIERLLDIGRLESGRALMELRPVSPERLIADATDRFSIAYRDRGVSLLTLIEPGLSNVLADLSRIGHVFSNLLDNALKYTPSGGSVTILAKGDGAFVSFAVKDTGRGIPKESLSKIFERFYRVPDQEETKGAGLGLAIAREIVEAHGGTLGVTSTYGTGSTFTFTLKIAS